eukprot:Sdes_comp15381_c0_seq1m4259
MSQSFQKKRKHDSKTEKESGAKKPFKKAFSEKEPGQKNGKKSVSEENSTAVVLDRKGRSELRTFRRQTKSNFDVIQQTKKIWEVIRQKNCAQEKRKTLIEDLMNLIRGKVCEIIFKHDAARIIQCAIQYGTPENRTEILKELDGKLIDLAIHRYSKFILSKLLKCGTHQHRETIIQAMYGHVRKLIRHREASVILETIYGEYANSFQRFCLVQEFYGPQFSLFKTSETKSLQDIFQTNPE